MGRRAQLNPIIAGIQTAGGAFAQGIQNRTANAFKQQQLLQGALRLKLAQEQAKLKTAPVPLDELVIGAAPADLQQGLREEAAKQAIENQLPGETFLGAPGAQPTVPTGEFQPELSRVRANAIDAFLARRRTGTTFTPLGEDAARVAQEVGGFVPETVEGGKLLRSVIAAEGQAAGRKASLERFKSGQEFTKSEAVKKRLAARETKFSVQEQGIIKGSIDQLGKQTKQDFTDLGVAKGVLNLLQEGGAGQARAAQLQLAKAFNGGRPTEPDYQKLGASRKLSENLRGWVDALMANKPLPSLSIGLAQTVDLISRARIGQIRRARAGVLTSLKAQIKRAQVRNRVSPDFLPSDNELEEFLTRGLPTLQSPAEVGKGVEKTRARLDGGLGTGVGSAIGGALRSLVGLNAAGVQAPAATTPLQTQLQKDIQRRDELLKRKKQK